VSQSQHLILPAMNDVCSTPRLFFAAFAPLQHVMLLHYESLRMPFSNDPFASSLIGRSALTRLVFVAAGIAVLWATIGWAVALA
jgi:hypothetical protein